MNNRMNAKVVALVETALLAAIEILFAFTPIGYLKIGIVEITFMTIPVAIGAMLVGPGCSTLLGFIFGMTSFIQCFGMSAFGEALFAVNPVGTFIICVVARTLMGLAVGFICYAFSKWRKNSLLAFVVTAFSAAVLNTLLFIGFFALFFHAVNLTSLQMDVSQMTLVDILVALAGLNGLIEAGVCTVVSPAIGKAIVHFVPAHK